jgi:integrase/recombinase XerD
MKPAQPNALARSLWDFFHEYLPGLRGMSPHTIHSYRDTFVLLLRFLAATRHLDAATVDVEHLDPQTIIAYLTYLEEVRHNQAATRNVRLAAIHAFFRYIAARYPERLEQAQRILGIPFKRTSSQPIDYFEADEIQTLLARIDRATAAGRRDYALLATMFNTGARVQEIVDVQVRDLQLSRPYQVRLSGKGQKVRYCPLWPQTTAVLQVLCAERALAPDASAPVFLNQRGQPLTRFGVRYILAKHCAQATDTLPTLAKKRLHPHSMRHSTAVHLLKSGVDLVSISHWLGHASPNTTNRYAMLDVEMKRAAIAQAQPPHADAQTPPTWKTDPSLLAWLESL